MFEMLQNAIFTINLTLMLCTLCHWPSVLIWPNLFDSFKVVDVGIVHYQNWSRIDSIKSQDYGEYAFTDKMLKHKSISCSEYFLNSQCHLQWPHIPECISIVTNTIPSIWTCFIHPDKHDIVWMVTRHLSHEMYSGRFTSLKCYCLDFLRVKLW